MTQAFRRGLNGFKMTIYTTFNHPICKRVLSQIDVIADIDMIIVKPRKNLGNGKVYYVIEDEIINQISDMPILVDKDKVIEGLKIIDYLASNIETKKFLISETTLNEM